MNNLFALFVGVNTYAHIRRPLTGCINDVNRMEAFFQKHVAGSFTFHSRTLTNIDATKAGIVNAFEEHLLRNDLKPGDVLLYYFSGHGAEEAAHPAFWHDEPNRKLQVLACQDSNLETGKNFLADKELRYLIHKAAKPGVEVVAIFDCCHSGDNTRNLTVNAVERLAGAVRQRDWSDFIFADEISSEMIRQSSLKEVLPQGIHMQLAACDSHESAYEKQEHGGFFTTALLAELEQCRGDISYLELKNRTRNRIRGMNLDKYARPQTPQLFAFDGKPETWRELSKSLFKTFLGGVIREKPIASQVYFNQQLQRWEVDKGAAYGVTKTWQNVPQQITVTIPGQGTELASVEQVFPGFAIIEFEPYARVSTRERYDAFVPSLMSRVLPFYFQGDDAEKQAFLGKISTTELQKNSLKCVDSAAQAEVCLLPKEGAWTLTNPGDHRPLTAPVAFHEPEKLLSQLKSISRWAFAKNLQKNPASEIPDEAFDIRISQNG
ncbi:MAG: caspase family protein, partial [Bacteroidota bacterium]